MATFTVTDDVLLSAQAEAYFTTADSRVARGLRATLAMLSIPIPAYAHARPPGRPPGNAVVAAFRADNPHALPADRPAPRKPNASPATLAAARQRNALPAA